jgi:GDPmannose 4,6-dehydratase
MEVKPHEVYNLGAQSHVRVSFDMPIYTAETVGDGRAEAAGGGPRLPAGVGAAGAVLPGVSSEQYGKVVETPQKETTPFYPRSPYACAK